LDENKTGDVSASADEKEKMKICRCPFHSGFSGKKASHQYKNKGQGQKGLGYNPSIIQPGQFGYSI